ncbi:unnamed protein product [Malus baccata var. baccata]
MKKKNGNCLSNVHEESENKNPNIPASIPRCKTKSKKAVVNPSSEKKKQKLARRGSRKGGRERGSLKKESFRERMPLLVKEAKL